MSLHGGVETFLIHIYGKETWFYTVQSETRSLLGD